MNQSFNENNLKYYLTIILIGAFLVWTIWLFKIEKEDAEMGAKLWIEGLELKDVKFVCRHGGECAVKLSDGKIEYLDCRKTGCKKQTIKETTVIHQNHYERPEAR